MRVRTILVSAALGALLLAGCAQEPGEPEKSEPTAERRATVQTPTPGPAKTAQPEASAENPWTMPKACAEVVSSEQLARIDSRLEPMEYSETSPWEAEAKSRWEYSLGPVALAAMASATETINCSWGIPMSDAGATVFVGRISEKTADELSAALSDSVWEAYRLPGARHAFSNPVNSEHRVSTHLVVSGELLVIDEHTIAHPSEDFAAFALENIDG